MRPPIKYVGGKGKLLDQISNYIPDNTTLIVEPFCGSAALSFSNGTPFFLSDKSPELINFLDTISDIIHLDKVIMLLLNFEQRHSKDFYLHTRSMDRQPDFKYSSRTYRAARYYYIIYAGYNGLYRVNKSNQCNTPWGDRGFKVDTEHLIDCHNHLRDNCKGVFLQEFDNLNYLFSSVHSGEKPFVFIDPPYYGEKVFKQYTPEGDGGDFYTRLCSYLYNLENNNIKFLMTNTYCDHILDMFNQFNIEKVATKYSVAADGCKRGVKFESFISNG